MVRIRGRFGYYITYHLRQNKTYYLLLILALSIGVALGVVLHFTSGIGSYFLSDRDQQIFDFVTKEGSVFGFFYSKAINELVAFLLIFICGLSVYSSFLIGMFFVYHGLIFGACCCEIISIYKFMGVVNVFVLLVPINFVLFVVMLFFATACLSRAVIAKKYNIGFRSSFSFDRNFWKKIIFSFLFVILFVFVVSVVLSFILRSVSFVVF